MTVSGPRSVRRYVTLGYVVIDLVGGARGWIAVPAASGRVQKNTIAGFEVCRPFEESFVRAVDVDDVDATGRTRLAAG